MADYYDTFPDRCDLLGPKMVSAFKARHFDAYYCKTAEDAKNQALDLIPEGSSVSWAGSLTIRDIGLVDAISAGNYDYIDRELAKDAEEKELMMRKTFSVDTFLSSANAITEDGEFVNIDGLGNRVAAITFGPKSVIIIVGMNKVCKTLEDAYIRARNCAAPLNTLRFGLETPCSKTGSCADCKSPSSVCTYISATRLSKPAGRIKIILVAEPLGY